MLGKNNKEYITVDAEENPELCAKYQISTAPTLLVIKDHKAEKLDDVSSIIKYANN